MLNKHIHAAIVDLRCFTDWNIMLDIISEAYSLLAGLSPISLIISLVPIDLKSITVRSLWR